MRILFLDDEHRRFTQCWEQNNLGNDLFHASTAAQAIAFLETTEPFDVVSLDHDLTDEHYASGDFDASGNLVSAGGAEQPDSGLAVAKFIAHMPAERRPKRIYLHTWNPYGRDRMRLALIDVSGVICRKHSIGQKLSVDCCIKCGGDMKPGEALQDIATGIPDFAGGNVCTVSPGAEARLIGCMKCEDCGWSVTA